MREGDEDSSDDEDTPLADRRFVKSNQPGGSDPHVDPVQASAEHVAGAQGGEDSSSPSSDESNASESDGDAPRASRGAGKSKAVAPPVVCAVEVDSRVEVRWSDRQGGWSPCTVVQISSGRTRNPRNKSECVVRGYAIVEYAKGWRCHHNLDRDHHVSRFGNREWAWREAPSPATKKDASARGSHNKVDSAGAARGAKGPAAPSGGEASSSSTVAAKPQTGGADVSANASGSSPSAARDDESGPSHWSLSFCEKYYSSQKSIRRSTAVFDAGTYEVSRATLSSAKRPNAVKFSVVAGSGRMFYVAHSKETGPTLINVKNVFPPCDNDWSKTLRCYRVFTSMHASTRAAWADDILCDKGGIESLGKLSLRAQAREDEKSDTQTYHSGDVPYWVDVRHVIGVVRWAPMSYRSACSPPDFPENYWSGCPGEADLIYVGQHFSQVK